MPLSLKAEQYQLQIPDYATTKACNNYLKIYNDY